MAAVSVNHIRAQRLARGWTLQALATRVGTTKAQIDKLERGQRRLTVDWLIRLGEALAVDPRLLLPDDFAPVAAQAMIPVYTLQRRGDRWRRLARPCARVPRPYFLEPTDGYALRFHDDPAAALPWRVGQTLFVDPVRAPQLGQWVALADKDGTGFAAVAKITRTALTLVLGAMTSTQPRAAVTGVIVGLSEI